ncbi:MAG: endolytic transglycosylase MltG [Bacteroidaceae bacterium]|nr:endolytic transglycosylase MltG [Bacteroidaceae bacterium]
MTKERKGKSRKGIITVLFLAIFTATAYIGYTLGYKYYTVKMLKVKTDDTTYIYITPQDNAASIIAKIQNAVPGANTDGFATLAKHNNFDIRKRSGKYAIKNGDTMSDIYNRIVSRQQTPVRVTIPATRDIHQAISAISNQLMTDSAELVKYTNPIVISCFGVEEAAIPAFFIPDTYEVYWDISAEDFFEKLSAWNRKFWNEERKAKAKAAGLTPAEVSTLASIVDEETANLAEMPTVAGLYINRLKRGMLLQADPTVKFAIGDPTRKRILNKDLEVNSPYNTYKHKGLPPGPIRIPTKQAIESVLNYEKHDYLYMCAKEDFSGTHNFAKTLNQHNANAKKYQQALNKLNIKK